MLFVSDPTFYFYPNDSELMVRDTVALNCRVRTYGNVNISVEITDSSGQRLAYEEHSLLKRNNFTVQHQVNVTSSPYRAFCRITGTVVGMTPIYKTLDITVNRVLGKSSERVSNFISRTDSVSSLTNAMPVSDF